MIIPLLLLSLVCKQILKMHGRMAGGGNQMHQLSVACQMLLVLGNPGSQVLRGH
jgi:hypothetical protein